MSQNSKNELRICKNIAVAEAQLADNQYSIARGGGGSMEAPHFDGAAIVDQLATRANHSGNSPNAELVWDEDFGEMGGPGQPFIRLTRTVAAGEEILVDYGRWFAYAQQHFARFESTSVPSAHTRLPLRPTGAS